MPDYELKLIQTLEYKRPEVDKGYVDQTLYVNVSNSEIAVKPVDQKTKEVFIGGKGYDLWLLWNAVEPTTRWNDPQNAVCIACGPMGGTPSAPGSGKSIVTSLSPLTGAPIDSNVGGYFGPYLKFSGFDAMEIQGKASEDTVIFIDGIEQQVQILSASGLPENAYDLSTRLTEHLAPANRAAFPWFQPDRARKIP